jgi:hypothetical protein
LQSSKKSPISSLYFLDEARRIVDKAVAEGITLRILGAVAVSIHSPEFTPLHQSLERVGGATDFTDLDVIGYSRDRASIELFFRGIGITPEPRARKSPAIWAYRQMYVERNGNFHIDVFFDKLEMSHTIDFNHRLEVDYPTISLADLLLEKMQIHRINEKDIKDTVVLMRAHSLGPSDQDIINEDYIAKLLSNDWGFYYTVANNLNKTKLLLDGYSMAQADKDDVTSKIDRLISRIDSEPKSMRFRMRAKVGEKKKWYNEVDETFR